MALLIDFLRANGPSLSNTSNTCSIVLYHIAPASKLQFSSRKKKKVKIQEADDNIPPKSWHLRALVLSSLKNCFLYDTGSVEFLDSNNFQVLLKPITSQIVVEPPASLVNYAYVPSVLEVDELVVSCIGQMAVAAGSDLLWKLLNLEVLMQTRTEGEAMSPDIGTEKCQTVVRQSERRVYGVPRGKYTVPRGRTLNRRLNLWHTTF